MNAGRVFRMRRHTEVCNCPAGPIFFRVNLDFESTIRVERHRIRGMKDFADSGRIFCKNL